MTNNSKEPANTEPSTPSVEMMNLAAAIVASQPGFKVSLRSLGSIGITAVFLIAIWSIFVSPTQNGKALLTATHAIEGMSRVAGSAPPYANIEMQPIRDTIGSVWANDIAQAASIGNRGEKTMSGVLASSHGPEVLMALQEGFSGMHNRCTVRVSAQAFDHPGTPYAPLLSRIGAREDTFVVVMAHEMAHCYWHPGPMYEDRLNKVTDDPVLLARMTGLMPLIINMAESYGDSYSLIFSARVDRSLYARAYQGISAFRGSKGVKSDVYNTLNAIETAAEIAPTLPDKSNPMSVRWDVTNRYVLSATLTGSMKWLMGRGKSREEATGDINFVLQGQGIEFEPRTVAGKDYLIVTKAPDGFSSVVNAESSADNSTVQETKKQTGFKK